MSRRNARENAFKMIFAIIAREDETIPESFFDEVGDGEIWSGKDAGEESRAYITAVCRGIREHLDEIDGRIKTYLKNWEIDRINRVCLAALRLAFYEIRYMDEIPVKVSASETVEIVKKYAGGEEAKFVNGVLGEYIRQECAAPESE